MVENNAIEGISLILAEQLIKIQKLESENRQLKEKQKLV